MVEQIKDKLGRPIRDLRLSVTDRCNFRCDYCMPKEVFGDDFVFLPKNELLTFDEMARIAKVYAELGVKKIRITGGEPLMRRDLDVLIAKLNQIDGIEDIGLTTNGLLLKKSMDKSYMMLGYAELMSVWMLLMIRYFNQSIIVILKRLRF